MVEVHYSGWTTDGKMFDSSVTRGEPATFPLNGVIPGWTEGVQLMVVGEKTRFWIPGELAYDSRPARRAQGHAGVRRRAALDQVSAAAGGGDGAAGAPPLCAALLGALTCRIQPGPAAALLRLLPVQQAHVAERPAGRDRAG